MAFTFAHPAAVLSLVDRENKDINSAGLIIGAMAPDFEYFLYFKPKSVIGHSIVGMFSINLILSFVLYILFYSFIKNKFILNLPKVISDRMYKLFNQEIRLNNFRDYLIFGYSSLVGMTSHIVWDSFTHETGYFVDKIRLLSKFIFNIPIYKILQHGSTLIGFVLILLFVLGYEKQDWNNIKIKDKFGYWTATSVVTLILFILFMRFFSNYQLGATVITLINSFFISLLIVSISMNYEIDKK